MAHAITKFLNSPVGPRTIHFWGPFATWGLILAGSLDYRRSAECISEKMTATLFVYSCLFMRFAWMIKPRNLFNMSAHFCNASVQAYLFSKKMAFNRNQNTVENGTPEVVAASRHVTKAPRYNDQVVIGRGVAWPSLIS